MMYCVLIDWFINILSTQIAKLSTDFAIRKPRARHQANGGFGGEVSEEHKNR